MKRHLNLMSDGARFREILRKRLRQWSVILSVILLVLGSWGSMLWWSSNQVEQIRLVAETKYNPIRQLKLENKKLLQQIESLQNEERVTLAISEEKPAAMLLGLISSSVAESGGKVFIQQFAFRSNVSAAEPLNVHSGSLELDGVGIHREAVMQFVNSLQSSAPFASVKMTSIESIEVNRHLHQAFTIECTF